MKILDAREENLEVFDDAQRTSIDFYATVRDAYEQSRRSEIREEEGGSEMLPEF